MSDGLYELEVRPSAATLLAQLIKIVAADPRRTRGLGELVRRKIADEFSIDRSAKAIARTIAEAS